MSKIHPDDAENNKQYDRAESKEYIGDGGSSRVLTVWKRSSMTFQGTDGFTVFDQHGRLVFRVDNYSRKNGFVAGGGLVLMDGAGNALLTLKTQILRLQTQWDAYRGDQNECGRSSNKSIVFSMRSCSSGLFRSRKDMTDVFMGGVRRHNQTPEYRIEGSFRARDCKIRKASGQVVAKMARKRVNNTILLNSDVFSLFVQPGFDAELVMAFVIILDRMSSKPFTPLLCS